MVKQPCGLGRFRWVNKIANPATSSLIVYMLLARFYVVPMDAGYFLDSILGIAIIAFLVEVPLGRYRKRT